MEAKRESHKIKVVIKEILPKSAGTNRSIGGIELTYFEDKSDNSIAMKSGDEIHPKKPRKTWEVVKELDAGNEANTSQSALHVVNEASTEARTKSPSPQHTKKIKPSTKRYIDPVSGMEEKSEDPLALQLHARITDLGETLNGKEELNETRETIESGAVTNPKKKRKTRQDIREELSSENAEYDDNTGVYSQKALQLFNMALEEAKTKSPNVKQTKKIKPKTKRSCDIIGGKGKKSEDPLALQSRAKTIDLGEIPNGNEDINEATGKIESSKDPDFKSSAGFIKRNINTRSKKSFPPIVIKSDLTHFETSVFQSLQDVHLVSIEGKRFTVNRSILAAASAIFSSILCDDAHFDQEVIISEVNEFDLQFFVQFVTTGIISCDTLSEHTVQNFIHLGVDLTKLNLSKESAKAPENCEKVAGDKSNEDEASNKCDLEAKDEEMEITNEEYFGDNPVATPLELAPEERKVPTVRTPNQFYGLISTKSTTMLHLTTFQSMNMMPNSVCTGFGTAMKMGSAHQDDLNNFLDFPILWIKAYPGLS